MITLGMHSENRFVAVVRYRNGRERSVHIGAMFADPEETLALLTPVVDAANALAVATQRERMKGMAALGKCFRRLRYESMPRAKEEWQELLNNAYSDYLLREGSDATLKTRTIAWSKSIVQPLKDLQRRGHVIPVGVEFPARKKLPPSGWNSSAGTITGPGQRAPVEKPIEKILVDTRFGSSDASFLESVRDDLTTAVALMNEGALMWWKCITEVVAYGQRIKREYGMREDLNSAIQNFGSGLLGSKREFIGGGSEDSLGRLLTYIETYSGGRSFTAVQKKDKIFPRSQEDFSLPPGAPKHPLLKLSTVSYINWMLGRLGPLDIAMALIILQSHLPKFPPMTLGEACIRTDGGKELFELRGESGQVFRLEKARVHGIKSEMLDEDSAFVIQSILDTTRDARAALQSAGSVDANRLFIVYSRGSYQSCPYESATYHLTMKKNGWLLDYLPELKLAGLVKGSLTLEKIRSSECVIEWFRTGSVLDASVKIGNTTRVALEHYIPESLIEAWNVRLIRRFQNLWICLSAANENYLLKATDFQSMEDLQGFVTQMLQQHEESSSGLAAELHKRFANLPAANPDGVSEQGNLMIGIDVDSLSYLYCYRDLAYQAGLNQMQMDKIDASAGLAPRALIDLADLLTARLATHEISSLAVAHKQAMHRASQLRERLALGDFIFSDAA